MTSNPDVEKLINMKYGDLLPMLEAKAEYYKNMVNYYNLIYTTLLNIESYKSQRDQITVFNLHPSDEEIEKEIKESEKKTDGLIANATDDVNKSVDQEKQQIKKIESSIESLKQELEKWEKVKRHRILYLVAGIFLCILAAFIPLVGSIAEPIIFLGTLYVVFTCGSKVSKYENAISKGNQSIKNILANIVEEKDQLQKRIDYIKDNNLITKEQIQSRNEKRLKTVKDLNEKMDKEAAAGNKYIQAFNDNSVPFYKDNIIPQKYWSVLDQLVTYLENGEAKDWISVTNLKITENNFNKVSESFTNGLGALANQIKTYQQDINNQFASTSQQLVGLQNNLNNASLKLQKNQDSLENLDTQVKENGYKISRIKNVVAPEEPK